MFKKDEFAVTWYKPNTFVMEQWEWELNDPSKFNDLYFCLDSLCRWSDCVVWMGLHTPKSLDMFVHFRAKYGKPFVSEFDDFIFSIPQTHDAWKQFRPGMPLTTISLEQVKQSDALIVSTPHLKKLYAPFCNDIYVVENSIDISLWRNPSLPHRRNRQGVTIGWMGGGTHNADHLLIKDAVYEVLEKCPNVNFTYISGGVAPKGFEHPRINWIPEFRSIDKYPRWIASEGFDIGIVPLVDTEFNRGKSNLRWLEYSAMGIPTVASNVLHFRQSVEHGKTGFLAGTHEKWVKILTKLVNEPKLRENIGRAARLEVKNQWRPEVQARKYRAALQKVCQCLHKRETASQP
jgi:glycosyltransferase involved in cell wall biosynthesis